MVFTGMVAKPLERCVGGGAGGLSKAGRQFTKQIVTN